MQTLQVALLRDNGRLVGLGEQLAAMTTCRGILQSLRSLALMVETFETSFSGLEGRTICSIREVFKDPMQFVGTYEINEIRFPWNEDLMVAEVMNYLPKAMVKHVEQCQARFAAAGSQPEEVGRKLAQLSWYASGG